MNENNEFNANIQYIPYILSNLTYIRLREWASKIFSIFNPEITNIFFFYSILGVYVILTLYIYTVFFYHLQANGRYLVQYISYSLVYNYLTLCTYICHRADFISGISNCGTVSNNIL
ncbi:hypothetical protein H8356DRAFT_1068948 [Neocallimastix lanati (nom. inval.)]|uniref:Uncharacterized protein n=1 Tax=Neocallimastix californiae TaxID=1754190 RepID=A0A1Y2B5E3_9FUNG|nr:hypothetical protein H8356DRAFT_1068948 [Neocallimastix sp. JGI-2020a]ORY30061.1 hypothetical protein LY90DRAFT_512732 [Neocallimastix californiae]|eukprot:ORY30061.1 hypothetical protein LY90DRAFT_512732 [Neocallimastix californiae]